MIRAVDSKEIPQVADMFIEFIFELKVISGDSYFDFDQIVKADIINYLVDFLNCDTRVIY